MNDPIFCKPTLRNVWTNLPLTLSAVAFMTLAGASHGNFYYNPINTALISFLPFLIASAFVKHAYNVMQKTTIYSVVASVIISVALLYMFIKANSIVVNEQLQSLADNKASEVFHALCGVLCLLSTIFCTYLINWMLIRSDNSQEELCAKILRSRALRITIKCCVILSICLYLLFVFDNFIVLDESFTLKMICLNYADLIDMTAHDVHLPLYYIMLKLWVDVLSFGSKNIELTIILSRLFSLLAYALTAILCYVKLSKSRIASWRWMLLLCFFAMQSLLIFCLRIRMYSWALLFVTATYLFTIDIVNGKTNWKTWTAVAFFTLCAAYTHNYALMSVALIWLFLLCWILKQDKRLLVKWLVYGFAVSILYFPWFLISLGQIHDVTAIYSPKLFVGFIVTLLSPVHILIPFLLVKTWRDKHIKRPPFAYFLGMLVPISTAAVGIALSLALRPIFAARYIIPTNICLWIFIFFVYSRATEKDKLLLVLCLFLAFILTTGTYTIAFRSHCIQTNNTHNFIKQVSSENAIFIVPDDEDMWILSCLTDKEIVEYHHRFWPRPLGQERVQKMLPNLKPYEDKEAMWSYLNISGKAIYSVERASNKIDEVPAPDNYTKQFIGEYTLEYPCYFYKLTPRSDNQAP